MKRWVPELVLAAQAVILSIFPVFVATKPSVYIPIVVGVFATSISIVLKVELAKMGSDRSGLDQWASLALAARLRLEQETDPVFRQVGSAQVRRAGDSLQLLSEGSAAYPYVQYGETIVTSVGTAKHSIDATHDCRAEVRRDAWRFDRGRQQYLEKQRVLIAGGVVISRVFVLPAVTMLSATDVQALEEIAQQQLAAGVELHAVFEDDLGAPWTEDLVIVDKERLHRYQFGNRTAFEQIIVSVDRDELKNANEKFRRLLLRSDPWGVVSTRLGDRQ